MSDEHPHAGDRCRAGARLPGSGGDPERRQEVAIIAGRGALGAGDELEQLAEVLGAPIIKPLLGKACVPDDSPYTTGGIGLLGTAPSRGGDRELRHAAASWARRSRTSSSIPKPGQARGVQIDIDPKRIGLRYPVEVGLVGASKPCLQALMPTA